MTINDEIAYALLAYRVDEWSLGEAIARVRGTLHPEPATSPGKTKQARATKAIALDVGTRHGVSTPSALREALTGECYDLPTSPSTIENWCSALRERTTKNGTAANTQPSPSDADIAACWREHGHPGAGTLRTRLAEQGWNPGGESTLRRKIADFRQLNER